MRLPARERHDALPANTPGPLVRAVLALRRALIGLADSLVPAELALLERSTGAVDTQLLGAIARLGIADLLEEGPLTADALARATGTRADRLHRALRALASRGVFTLRDGRFENNRLSRALREGSPGQSRAWCEYFASRSNLGAWAGLEHTLREGGSAFERVHGMSVWDWFSAHPDERATFARAMSGITALMAPVIARIYPFAELQIVCDVAGGNGTLLAELFERHPHLRGVICDAEGTLAFARELLAGRGLAERAQLVAADLFEAVPEGADAYLLKNVLHDWDDARCLRILEVCHRAMRPGSRLLIAETLCERDETLGFAPFSDVQMMVVCSDGRERGRDEYAALLRQAGFEPGRVFESPTVSIIEAYCSR